MIQGIDHIVILVDDLDTALTQYRDLGFTVNPGGRHPRGTHNALVTFQDGSYLELIAFWEPDYAEHRWHRHLAVRRGLIDFALGSDRLAADVTALSARGLRYTGPHDGARKRHDGVELVWKVAASEDEGALLPFLIEDVTRRELRVPADAAIHANGVLGVERIVIAVDDLAAATRQYGVLLGSDPIADNGDGSGKSAATATFQSGPHRIELRQTQPDGSGSSQAEGPSAAVLSGSRELDIRPEDAGGAHLRVIAARA